MITTLYPVQSIGSVHFLQALAAAGGSLTPPFVGTPINNIPGVPPIRERRFLIRTISYTGIEQVGLEFDFFADAAGTIFLGRYQFASSNGWQLNALGLFTFYVDGLAIPYWDKDRANTQDPPRLHVAAQNVDLIAKSIGELGTVVLTVWLEPMQSVQG